MRRAATWIAAALCASGAIGAGAAARAESALLLPLPEAFGAVDGGTFDATGHRVGQAQMSVANTSQHLQRLKQARLVRDERQGTYMCYRLADPAVARLWVELRSVAEKQLAEVDQALDAYRTRRHTFRSIPPAELQERMNNEEIVLLDVRPTVEYEAGHIAGAISIPFDEVERRLAELPTGKVIVAYCRGPYCVYADDALATLAAHGWEVARLEEGVLEWQLATNGQT